MIVFNLKSKIENDSGGGGMKWPEPELRKVAEVVSGSGFPLKYQGNTGEEFPFFKVGDMNLPGNERYMTTVVNTISEETLKKLKAKVFPKGTVIFPKIGAAIATNKKRMLVRPSIVDNNVMGIIPGELIDESYLFYWMQQFDLRAVSNIGPVPSMRKTEVERVRIPLPPLSEQRRIVEILDQADALRKKRAEADKKAERILTALFYKMFGDPATNPKGWQKRRLGELCRIVSGATPRTNIPEYWNGEIPWVTPKDLSSLRDFLLKETERKISQAGFDSCSTVMLPEGSVLLSSRAPIGLIAIAGIRVCTNQGFKSFICGEDINPWYLFAWLKINTHYLNALGRGATFKEISQTIVRSIEIHVPDRTLQDRFANHLKDVRQTMLKRHTAQDKVNRLFELLLHRAFTGDLTAKWREAHMKELLAEMEEQAKALNLEVTA
jgi:type I restriction enzyme S subunit